MSRSEARGRAPSADPGSGVGADLARPDSGSASTPRTWSLELPRGRTLQLSSRPRVVGILNITPDSFSDGGLYVDPHRAVGRGLAMLEEGADAIDLGAESTRPGGGVYGAGADQVSAEEELRRLLPVLERLRPQTDAPLSIDTRKGEVARRVLAAGADVINDVGGLSDPELVSAVAEAGCPVIAMHSRGELATMQRGIRFSRVVHEVRDELAELLRRAESRGVQSSQLILDPGIGFGKTAEQSLRLLGALPELDCLGRPLLIGASRKSFIAGVAPAPPDQRLGGSLAAVAWASALGAALVRVHDVAETAQFLKVWNAIDSTRRSADRGSTD